MLAVENLISIDNIIAGAKKQGINFGKGDPYNRLRYYTKIGWLPHMVRKADKKNTITGHYPDWALRHLILIEQLKSRRAGNDEISRRLFLRNRIQNISNVFSSKEFKTQAIVYLTLATVLIILANELGVIQLGKAKNQLYVNNIPAISASTIPAQIIDSGTAFVPKNQNTVFVKSTEIRNNYKVEVTFNQNYSPATRYFVSEIIDYSGFVVELDSPVSTNVEFNWWVTN
mgnify:CR=1 FL=1